LDIYFYKKYRKILSFLDNFKTGETPQIIL